MEEKTRAALSALLAAILSLALSGCAKGGPVKVDRSGADIDGAAVLATVAELSSPAYAGRQAGSPGGGLARDWLAARLRQAGLAVSEQEFPERVGQNREAPSLVVTTAGGARTFAYREDFREIVRGGFEGGRVSGPLVALDGLGDAAPPRGSILLVPADRYSPEGYAGFAAFGAAGLIVELSAGSVEARPLWAGQPGGTLVEPRDGLVVLAASPAAYAELLGLAGSAGAEPPFVDMASPVRFADVRCANLIASWNGDGGDFKPRFAFMAHYDHVGTDADGSFFPGALDNASGAAMALALAEAFARDRRTADVAFFLTDAEEVGLSGAGAHASRPPYPLADLVVVNLDMLGSASDLPLSVYSNGDRAGLSLADELVAALEGAGFRAVSEYPVPNVDHSPLVQAGATAVTVCEYDESAYHTKRDQSAGLSAAELDRLGDALYAFALGKMAGKP